MLAKRYVKNDVNCAAKLPDYRTVIKPRRPGDDLGSEWKMT